MSRLTRTMRVALVLSTRQLSLPATFTYLHSTNVTLQDMDATPSKYYSKVTHDISTTYSLTYSTHTHAAHNSITAAATSCQKGNTTIHHNYIKQK